MQIAKQQVASMLQKLPDDCSLEDIQYHLYEIEKIKNGVARVESEGAARVGRNNQRALRRMFAKQMVQCASLIAPYDLSFRSYKQPREVNHEHHRTTRPTQHHR